MPMSQPFWLDEYELAMILKGLKSLEDADANELVERFESEAGWLKEREDECPQSK